MYKRQEKYRKAAENACDAKLQHIFEKIEKAEQSHYDTVTGMLAGTLPAQQGPVSYTHLASPKAAASRPALIWLYT